MVVAEMEGVTEEMKSRAGENTIRFSAADVDGGEERRGVQFDRNGAVLAGGVGSGLVRTDFSVQKPIGEASISVFDGIPAKKVHEILRTAATAVKATETKNSISINPASSPALRRAPSFSSTSTVASPWVQFYPSQPVPFCRLAADLPIAERHSLQRFLEKRRDRLVNKNRRCNKLPTSHTLSGEVIRVASKLTKPRS